MSPQQPGPFDASVVRSSVGAFELHRDVVRVSGPDAVSYLQGQVSADVTELTVGSSTPALLLEPNGKLAVWCRITRTAGDEMLLDVDAGWGDVAISRLRRFLLRVDVEVEPSPRRGVALRGPSSAATAAGIVGDVVRVDVDWRGLPGVDVLGAVDGEAPAVPDDVPLLGRDVWDELRVEQGWPEMGRELDASTIPAEAGDWLIDTSVSFTKGCYTGQELVARVHSRGSHTPRHLRGLRFGPGGTHRAPEPGTPVLADGIERATVTSSTSSASLDAPIALAMLHRSVEPGATVEVGGRTATVVELPFT